MSGIFGIFNRNGKIIEEKTVNTMLDTMSSWEPDDIGEWIDGPVALGHTMLWNTPESKYEHLPLEKDAYILTMDARIDNRDELLEDLKFPDLPLGEIGDSEFILAAYQKWGEDCPKYLLGDFAFAIWDDKKEQLFCARDHVGVKQFYYHLKDDLFSFSNDLRVLIKHTNVSEKINDEAVANFIVNNQMISNTLTFFEEVVKLPPANTLTVTNKKVEKKCYWRLEDAPKVKLPNREAYAKKLRKLLEQSIYARMRSDYPITSHLSGGLDSSSIAVIAARKLREKDEKLLAFNWLHKPTHEDDSTYHEWFNSKMIAESENIEHHYVPLCVNDIHGYVENDTIVYGHSTRFWYEYPVRHFAQQKGSRSILSGWGGDEFVTYHGDSYYADLFLQGAWKKLFQELQVKIHAKQKSIKSILSVVYHHIWIPLVPRSLYCKIPKTTCSKKSESSFMFVKESFLPLINKEINKPLALTMQPHRTIKKDMLVTWKHGYIQSRIESWATAATHNRLEYSYPLLDKRIIEFVLGIPTDNFVHHGTGRYLFRLAVKGLLPENILWTNIKQEPRRVERLVSLMLAAYKLSVTSRGFSEISSKYIDSQRLMISLEKFECPTMDRDTLIMIKQIETSLALILSLCVDIPKREDTSNQ